MMRIVSVDHIRGGSSNLGEVVGTATAAATAMVAISEDLRVLLWLCDEAVRLRTKANNLLSAI